MKTPDFLRPVACALLALPFLLAVGCNSASRPPAEVTANSRGADGAFDDDPGPPTAAARLVSGAGQDPVRLAAAEKELLGILLSADTIPAAAQDAAEHLGAILLAGTAGNPADTLAALAPLLADDARSEHARLALDRVPGEAVDTLYLEALGQATGRTRLGLLDSIGSRRITAAVPAVGGLLASADAATAAAATRTLGRIGGAGALAVLDRPGAPLTPGLGLALLDAARRTDAHAAATVAARLYRDVAAPAAVRCAALRQLIAANPAGAIEAIHAALGGPVPAFRLVALEAVSSLPTPGSALALSERISGYAPEVQVALAAALGSLGDAGAVPGLLAALASPDETVRLAVLAALGRLPGDAVLARRLASLAAGRGPEAAAAAEALARLDGPGLDAFIQEEAAHGDTALQPVYLRQLAARNLTEAIPFLLGRREAAAEAIRLEVLDALRGIAGPAEQPALVAWATGAAGRAEQNRAVRALITQILREADPATRATVVLDALRDGDAAARLILLPVLSRVAGTPALNIAGALARSEDPAVAAAAAGELARWPDTMALPLLVELALGTSHDGVRLTAIQGAARFLSLPDTDTNRRSVQTRTLLALPLPAGAKVPLLNALSLCADEAALATARRFLDDADGAAAAKDAVDAITSNLAGPPVVTTSAAPEQANLLADGRDDTFLQVPMEPGLWIMADLHSARPVRKLTLDHRGRDWGYPGAFDLQVSNDPDRPGNPVASGEGERAQTILSLPAGVHGRYLWIRLTGTRDAPLAISELRVE